MDLRYIIDLMRAGEQPGRKEYALLLEHFDEGLLAYANEAAREVAIANFGYSIYKRGLLEVTNYCRNDCYYCGIRRSNLNAQRYRLSIEQVLECCREGYNLGFRTFVLQGGEDAAMSDDFIAHMVSAIHAGFPKVAITLSLGERSRVAYKRFYEAGANRYLLRHEAASRRLYRKLHPPGMSYDNRMESIRVLKELGYQTGAGMMVGSPGQTISDLVDDIMFISQFQPQMIGIGPYIPQEDTPLAGSAPGSTELTLLLVSIFRLMHPRALIPSTTALATLSEDGRQRGILAGANVVMPNLTPAGFREKYAIYDNKKNSGSEAAEGLRELEDLLGAIGYSLSDDRGDYDDCNNVSNKTTVK